MVARFFYLWVEIYALYCAKLGGGMKFFFKSLLCIAYLLMGSIVYSAEYSAFPGVTPGVNLSAGLPVGSEPSGIVWHERLQCYLIVSDGGVLIQLGSSGQFVRSWSVGSDLEGICVADVDSSFVYLGVEDPDSVLEFNMDTGRVTRVFNLTANINSPSNSGLEALTYVPSLTSLEGGYFYVGEQFDGKIYVFELPIQSSTTDTTVVLKKIFTPSAGRTDLSGLHYNLDNNVLYAVYDSADRITAMQADGTFIAEWNMPGDNQEGVVINGFSIVIAEDDGQVYRYDSFLKPSAVINFSSGDENTIEETISQLQEANQSLLFENDSLEQQLNTANIQIDNLNETIIQLQSENSSLEAQLSQCLQEKEILQSQNTDLSAENQNLSGRILALETEVLSLQDNNSALQNSLDLCNQENLDLQEQNAAIQAHSDSLAVELMNVSNALTSAQGSLAVAQADLNAAQSTITALNATIAGLSGEITDLNLKINACEKEISTLRRRNSTLQQENLTLRKRVAYLEGIIKSLWPSRIASSILSKK